VKRAALVTFSILLAVTSYGQPSVLLDIHQVLLPMREHPGDHAETRGATVVFDSIKHRLRDYVESNLKALRSEAEVQAFKQSLNEELKSAGLLGYNEPPPGFGPFYELVGFLAEIDLRLERGFLVFKTGVGIQNCGYDWSAYLYQWTDGHWQRVWQSEQNVYTDKEYHPQTLHEVIVSPDEFAGGRRLPNHLVMTLGSNSWCTSNWHSVHYRLWQIVPDKSPTLLVSESEGAYFADYPPIRGSLGPREMLVEFRMRSVDAGVHNRAAIRHYSIVNGRADRVDPIALGPHDFVDEWLTKPWMQSADWSDQSTVSLREAHEKLQADFVAGDFDGPSLHCEKSPDQWQVSVGLNKPIQQTVYFIVRWRPPYRFTMVKVSDQPSADCSEKDRTADQNRTLFPGR
jgi:hypothetical protein